MIIATNEAPNKQIYYRLVTLWIICEAFAGGIMHGIKIPFTGLIVSSLAVTCIVLIAYYIPSKSAIIKATVIVAIFKLMLSPHSPPTAYIAVFFQGLMGQLLFVNRRYFKSAAILLAVLSLVESAIQRILVLLIVYGSEFWNAVNQFIQKISDEKTLTNYSLMIAVIYIGIHAVIGIFVGIYAAWLAKASEGWKMRYPVFLIPVKKDEPVIGEVKKKRKKLKIIFIIVWLALLAAFIHAYFDPAHAILPRNKVSLILLRSILIVLGWYLLLAPLAMMVIKKLLERQQLKKQEEVNEIMTLIPQTKYIFSRSWQMASKEKGLNRFRFFLKILLINILSTGTNDR